MYVKTDPKIGNYYKFNYNGKKRVVYIHDVSSTSISTYDFIAGGHRNFSRDKIFAEDITDKVKEIEAKDIDFYETNGCTIHEIDNKYFALGILP